MPKYNAIRDRSGLTRDAVKQLIGVPASTSEFDERIDMHLRAAKEAADMFVCNPFHGRDWATGDYYDPIVEDPIPEQINEGIMVYVMWHLIRAASIDDGGGIAGFIDEEVGDVRVRYSGNYVTRDDLLRNIKGSYWGNWRLVCGF